MGVTGRVGSGFVVGLAGGAGFGGESGGFGAEGGCPGGGGPDPAGGVML